MSRTSHYMAVAIAAVLAFAILVLVSWPIIGSWVLAGMPL